MKLARPVTNPGFLWLMAVLGLLLALAPLCGETITDTDLEIQFDIPAGFKDVMEPELAKTNKYVFERQEPSGPFALTNINIEGTGAPMWRRDQSMGSAYFVEPKKRDAHVMWFEWNGEKIYGVRRSFEDDAGLAYKFLHAAIPLKKEGITIGVFSTAVDYPELEKLMKEFLASLKGTVGYAGPTARDNELGITFTPPIGFATSPLLRTLADKKVNQAFFFYDFEKDVRYGNLFITNQLIPFFMADGWGKKPHIKNPESFTLKWHGKSIKGSSHNNAESGAFVLAVAIPATTGKYIEVALAGSGVQEPQVRAWMDEILATLVVDNTAPEKDAPAPSRDETITDTDLEIQFKIPTGFKDVMSPMFSKDFVHIFQRYESSGQHGVTTISIKAKDAPLWPKQQSLNAAHFFGKKKRADARVVRFQWNGENLYGTASTNEFIGRVFREIAVAVPLKKKAITLKIDSDTLDFVDIEPLVKEVLGNLRGVVGYADPVVRENDLGITFTPPLGFAPQTPDAMNPSGEIRVRHKFVRHDFETEISVGVLLISEYPKARYDESHFGLYATKLKIVDVDWNGRKWPGYSFVSKNEEMSFDEIVCAILIPTPLGKNVEIKVAGPENQFHEVHAWLDEVLASLNVDNLALVKHASIETEEGIGVYGQLALYLSGLALALGVVVFVGLKFAKPRRMGTADTPNVSLGSTRE